MRRSLAFYIGEKTILLVWLNEINYVIVIIIIIIIIINIIIIHYGITVLEELCSPYNEGLFM